MVLSELILSSLVGSSASTERITLAATIITVVITATSFILAQVRRTLDKLDQKIERIALEGVERDNRSDTDRLKTAENVASLNATLIGFDKRLDRFENERRR